MPKYQIELTDGRKFQIEADREPTEADVLAALGESGPKDAPAETKSGPDWSYAPTLGGMVGGLGGLALGGPVGAIAGAMLGGGVGGAAKAYHEDPDSPTRAADIGLGTITEAGKQGVFEAIPQGIGGLLRKAAPAAMDMGLQRTQADRLNFPNTPKTLVDEGIIPTGNRPQAALDKTEAQVNARTAAYDAANPVNKVDPDQLAQEARTTAHTSGKLGGLGDQPGLEDAELDKLVQQYLKQNIRTRSLGETVQQKRAFQARSNYNNRPNAPTQTNNELNFNKGMAEANRGAAIKADPELEALLSKEKDLIGAVQAQKGLEAKAIPLSTVGTIKSAIGLRNPWVMGAGSIAMDRMGRRVLPLVPSMIRAAILAQLKQQGQ